MRWPVPIFFLIISISTSFVHGYPVLEHFVTDEVGVLLLEDIYGIEEICFSVQQGTGAEMAVLIVNTTQPDGIDIFTLKTFEENGIGQKDEDNGILILVSVTEKAYRVEVGYGLEGVLPDVLVYHITKENLEPYLNQSDYYSGLLNTVIALKAVIIEEYDGEPSDDDGPWYPVSFIPLTCWQWAIIIVIFIAISVLTKGKVFFLPLWLISVFSGKGGRGGFGGGRSGGGGHSGRF